MSTTHHDRLFIGGDWVAPAGSDRFDVICPSTEECIGSVPAGTAADIDRAVGAARRTFDDGDWSGLDAPVVRDRAMRLFCLDEAIRLTQLRSLAATSMSIRGGTDEIQRNILGERVLGLGAEPRADRAVSWAVSRRGV